MKQIADNLMEAIFWICVAAMALVLHDWAVDPAISPAPQAFTVYWI